ncbi:MAG: winged helix DNA-binding domain-containing protein [Litoreibacter sp.]|nr:winged helix DNA-binding domain-containing protein [Litoreibacter sp.]
MTTLPRLTNAQARRLFLHHHLLATRPTGLGKGDDLAALIHNLGFVQLDSINTVARAHHMILHVRRQSYRAPALDRVTSQTRQGFEHWTHDASIISMPFFPHWRHKMAREEARIRKQWSAWRRDGFLEKTEEVLRQIADQGACCSADVGADEKRSSGGWWDWHPSKTALEYLWRTGALSVCHRRGFRKYYDLTENVIPPEYLNARTYLEETVDWACNAALDRLGFATSGELANFWDLTTKEEAKTWCARGVADQSLIEIEVEGADGRLRKHIARPDVFERATTAPEPPGMIRILSPFDPALRDRKRAELLFGFHYRIEIFTPEAKRQYGYYVFPVLEGAKLICRIDMKCDRKSEKLNVRAFWPERGVRMGPGRRKRLHAALERTARLAGSQNLSFAPDWQRL